MCCRKSCCLRRHEKYISVPELISAGGCLYPHRSPFSLTWLYIRILFWILSTIITIYCYITCSYDTSYYSFFLYFNNWTLIIAWFYFSLSAILTMRIYQRTQPHHLPTCLQPINQFAISNMDELPSIKNLKLSLLHKYVNICFHLSVTNTFVLCIAFWIVEFVRSIHTFEHIYDFKMKVNVINNYAFSFLLILIDFIINANKLKYSSLWYIMAMTVIFHVWSSVFNYNAFLYHNDNDHMNADIVRMPHLFIYFNWDQTPGHMANHSLGYIVIISIVLYCYIVITHCVLCFVKSLFLYKWSMYNAAFIEHAFETDFEMNEQSDATALDDDMCNDNQPMMAGHPHRSKHGIVVYEKMKDTKTMTDVAGDQQKEKGAEEWNNVFENE